MKIVHISNTDHGVQVVVHRHCPESRTVVHSPVTKESSLDLWEDAMAQASEVCSKDINVAMLVGDGKHQFVSLDQNVMKLSSRWILQQQFSWVKVR